MSPWGRAKKTNVASKTGEAATTGQTEGLELVTCGGDGGGVFLISSVTQFPQEMEILMAMLLECLNYPMM